jgi:excisionase family DNA binding protein
MKELVKAFTAEEIAEYLRLHPYTVRKLAREKKIPAFRVGGQWRFRKDEIDSWSKNKKTNVTNVKKLSRC